MASSDPWPRLYRRKLTRRSLLRSTAVTGLGLATAAIVGCSHSGQPAPTGQTEQASLTGAITRTPAARTPRQFLPDILPAQTPETVVQSQPLALVNGVLIDGTGAPQVNDAWVLIRNGRIESTGGGSNKTPAHSEYQEIDVQGKTIMPGLVDAHVHITRQVIQVTSELGTKITQDSLSPFLRQGFTTLRDVGTATIIFTAMNTLVAGFSRNNQAPDVIWAGSIITTVGGYPFTVPRYAPSGQDIVSPEEGAALVWTNSPTTVLGSSSSASKKVTTKTTGGLY